MYVNIALSHIYTLYLFFENEEKKWATLSSEKCIAAIVMIVDRTYGCIYAYNLCIMHGATVTSESIHTKNESINQFPDF